MARINIEDSIHSEPSFKRLVRRLGGEDLAIGMLYRFWRSAQDYWSDECRLMPESEFLADGFEPILSAGLASQTSEGIYALGSEKRFAWLLQKRRASKNAAAIKKARRTTGAAVPDIRNEAAGHPEPPPQAPPDIPLTLTLTLKEERESLSEKLPALLEAWQETLNAVGIDKKASWEAEPILRLVQRHKDSELVRRALIGARHEPDNLPFVARDHLSVRRILANPTLFDKCVSWGSKKQAAKAGFTAEDADATIRGNT